jgi:hypothetical protein
VRFGQTALPNVAAGASGGLPTVDANLRVSANVTAMASGAITASTFAANALDAVWSTTTRTLSAGAITASTFAANALDAVWSTTTRTLSAGAITASTFAANALDAVWSTATRALTDKTGFSLSAAGIQGIWDALTSALTTVGSIGKLLVDNINATISSRSTLDGTGVQNALTSQGYTTTRAGYLDTLNGLVQAVWDKATSALTTVGSIGKLLVDNINATISSRSTLDGTGVQNALTSQGYTTTRAGYLDTLNGLVQAVWDKATSALTTVGSIGKLLVDNINATISSRSTLDGTGVQNALTSQGYTTTRAGYLDTLNNLVSNIWAGVTQAFFGKFFTQDSGETYGDAVDGSVVKEIASNASSDPTTIAAAVWDRLTSAITTVGSIGKLIKDFIGLSIYAAPLNSTQTAQAVLDAVAADYDDAGSIGEKINSGGGSGGDPLENDVPGSYAVGTAGWALGLLHAIYSRVISIGSNVTYSSPVSPDGKTMHIVQNDDYLIANGRPLIFPLPIGFPLLTPGQAVTLAVAKVDKTTQLITGLALDDSTMCFEMPAATSKFVPRGKSDYSILELTGGVYRSTPYVGTAIVSRARTS